MKSGHKRSSFLISCSLASQELPGRNHELQERKKQHQGTYFAKADKVSPCPAKQQGAQLEKQLKLKFS